MPLLERLWAAVVTSFSILTLTPVQDGGNAQIPLSVALPSPSSTSLPVHPHIPVEEPPSFRPPGVPRSSEFTCEYPEMVGWVSCSSPRDRKCWLRNPTTGEQYDIYTNYEKNAPKGITRYYELNITDGHWDADGMNFADAKLFNNTYPGPWIEACWGDRLIVNVTNLLSKNGTSVHWHGIRQLDSVQMDGVNGVTQCPIAPEDYFVYNFTLKQYGSSWYHSHYSVQYADGAAGPMTIHGPTSADYDEAVSPPMIMTDWYHNSSFYVLTTRNSSAIYKDILLNGRGDITKFNSSAAETRIKPALNVTFAPPKPGRENKRYLIRVINTSFDTTFVFSIDNHMLQVVSADFVPIVPYRNTSILVGIGQRYNVIVEANPIDNGKGLDPNGNYWIRTQVAPCFGQKAPVGTEYSQTGIVRYNDLNKEDPQTQGWPDILTYCSDETYTSLSPILPWIVGPPKNGIKKSDGNGYGEVFETSFDSSRSSHYPVAAFTLDNTGEALPMRVNYSDPAILHLDPKDNTTSTPLWRVVDENHTNNEWIYLVLTGRSGRNGAHPIHLHGHDFAILDQAEDRKWSPDKMNLKLINPPRRDVVMLPANGYVVMAFKADNPGPWLVHCHIALHISWGLGFQIMEDQAGAFNLWPNDSPVITETHRVCEKWNKWYNNQTHWAWPPLPNGTCKYVNNPDWCFQDDSGV